MILFGKIYCIILIKDWFYAQKQHKLVIYEVIKYQDNPTN